MTQLFRAKIELVKQIQHGGGYISSYEFFWDSKLKHNYGVIHTKQCRLNAKINFMCGTTVAFLDIDGDQAQLITDVCEIIYKGGVEND